MALVVRDNTPSPGFISWTGLHIVYKGVDYTIQDGNTNKRFVYWKPSVSTTILQTSDTLPELGDDDLLVFLNKNGIHVTVPTSTVVEGSLIVEESILTNALAANAVTAEKIASGAIEARHLAAESVTADAIAAGAIGAGAIAAGAILSEAIASGQVLANHIAAGQIQSNHIAANQIQANHITSGAITADKIASNAVTAAKIAAGAVTVDKIAAGAITADKIASNAVTAGKIAAGAINAANLFVDGVITGAKIASETITGNKIAAGAITADKIAVSQLSAIASNIGTITAGMLRNSANTAGILLSGTVPSGWNQYLNLSDSSKPFLQHPNLVLNQDGSATFSGVVESSEFNASISRFWRAWFRESGTDRVFVVTASGMQWRTTDFRFSAGIDVFENPAIGVIGNVYGMHLQLDAMVLVNRTNSGFSLTGVGYELKATPDGDGWMTTGAFEVAGRLRVDEIRSRSHPTTQIELDDLGLRLTGGDYILGTWHSVPTGSTGGLYHQGGKIHIYAQDSNYWRVNSGSGMAFYSGGVNGTIRGYIFHGSSNRFGLRSADGNWRVEVYNGGVYLHGTVEVVGSLFKSSSQRWKKNVRAWAPDPRILLSLRPVEFDFVEERGGNHDYGFIAEEVPEVFATENRESVSFDRITTALVVGWQDHESRIAALERALKKLERV